MSNLQVSFQRVYICIFFGIFGFVCTLLCFSSHDHKTKILIAAENKVISLWQAKIENKTSKDVCLCTFRGKNGYFIVREGEKQGDEMICLRLQTKEVATNLGQESKCRG